MILFSARFGRYASRYGPRWFMAVGPAIMALGILWYMRLPATSAAWRLHLNDPSTYLPPFSYVTDLLPAAIIFGIGLMTMVAPLTTAVMRSVPTHNAGLASSINNAVSRVGPQLAGALVFVFITASFYSYIAARSTFDVNSPQFRKLVSPLNPPGIHSIATLARDASVSSFHLAMMVGAVLLVAGAIISAVGITNKPVVEEAAALPKIKVHAPSHSGPGVCCPDEEQTA